MIKRLFRIDWSGHLTTMHQTIPPGAPRPLRTGAERWLAGRSK